MKKILIATMLLFFANFAFAQYEVQPCTTDTAKKITAPATDDNIVPPGTKLTVGKAYYFWYDEKSNEKLYQVRAWLRPRAHWFNYITNEKKAPTSTAKLAYVSNIAEKEYNIYGDWLKENSSEIASN